VPAFVRISVTDSTIPFIPQRSAPVFLGTGTPEQKKGKINLYEFTDAINFKKCSLFVKKYPIQSAILW
jgi:hypothetical protein